jgi:uncharacterized protein YegL
MQKHQVHNLIILDESGSMDSIKKTIVSGFNEIVQSVKGIAAEYPEQAHFISLVSFNSIGNKILHFIDPIEKLEMIDDKRYQPNSMTPLYDAMGFSFAKLKQVLENVKDYNVLVTIMTDGEENASREYAGAAIKAQIEALKLSRWTFTYIGADHDVEKFAQNLSISNTMRFEKNEADMHDMFARERSARSSYSSKIRFQKPTTDDFYEDNADKA